MFPITCDDIEDDCGEGEEGLSVKDRSEAIVKAEGRGRLAGGLVGLGGVVGRGEDCWRGEEASLMRDNIELMRQSSWDSSDSSSGPSPTTSMSLSGLPLALYSLRSCSIVK